MAMIGLGFACQDILGTNTLVYGCAVTQYESELVVSVAPGRIYQIAAIDDTAWSSLPINSNTILQQGISSSPTLFATPSTGLTSGQSVNYLIEAQFQQLDINPKVLSYYNSANPSQPFSGAGNNGQAQPTTRQGYLQLQILAGTPATTGSQTTPATTAGWVSLAVCTVAFGATSPVITIPQGSAYAQPNQSGSFTLTVSAGMTTTPTGTCYYATSGALCTLMLPTLSGTSNANNFQLSGLPAALQPLPFAGSPTIQYCPLAIAENGGSYATQGAYADVRSNSQVIYLGFLGSETGWASTATTKSVAGNITYRLF